MTTAHLLLTVPPEERDTIPFLPTGNEWVSLPMNHAVGAHVEALNVVSMHRRGLVELSGKPLLQPTLAVGGRDVPWEEGRYTHHWIPIWTVQRPSWSATLLLVTPPGMKGFVIIWRVQNRSRRSLAVDVGLTGAWSGVNLCIYSRRSLPVPRCLRTGRWTGTILLEPVADGPLCALALLPSEPWDDVGWGIRRYGQGPVMAQADGPSIRYRLLRRLRVGPGETQTFAVYCGVNMESDGAGVCAVDLARHGWESLLVDTESWLASHSVALRDSRLDPLVNRNLFFNYFYATGRALDTDDLVLVTSRSPRYYVSAAYWPRDAFLWSFPGLALVDAQRAREALHVGLTRHLRYAGIHSHYINGSVLYPGLELDQVCAYPIAVEMYQRLTGDESILDDPIVRQAIPPLLAEFRRQRHPDVALYRTFLLPTDDPTEFPYVTYNNVLVWRALMILAGLLERGGDASMAASLRAEAEAVRRAIYAQCLAPGPFGTMFVGAVDLRGRHRVYDEPPGSLYLLPYHGFCRPDDPVYVHTVQWINSSYNPHFYDGAFAEAGCLHAPHPWPMSAVNALFSSRRSEGLDFLQRVVMDNGLACETVDRETGVVKTGAAFASFAGYLAAAIVQVVGVEGGLRGSDV